ncbi:MAG: IS630 family transposase [Deltaproteobacteria bacterium]|nr:IS630 family transposase [Deltaproteobacteria bacterium]
MRKQDARKLDHKALTELRKRAVNSVQEGESPEVVARVFGISRGTIYGWLARYRQGGWGALDARKRGGRPPKLDARAIRWVYDTVTMKNPLQLKFPFALWTTAMVAKAIEGKFGVKLSRSSVSRLLNQLGLSAQRPMWRAYQQDPEAVERWINEEFPKVKALARRLKAEIFFGDEAGVRSDFHSGKTWAIKGSTPIVSTTGARFGLNLISAISAKGQMRFMVTKGRVGAATFIEFLKRLIYNVPHMIFLIVDGHPAHRAKKVTKFVESVKDRLRLFYLPPYSPELNPDEWVWNHLKNHAIGRQVIESKNQLKKAVMSHMRRLQKSKHLIRSFFCTETTCYAL